MIIATAGHVDHGKTRLVKALTGVDTDTLAEEKKRGLTIDIGFAYLPVKDNEAIGIIDVPGHDRFIRNALCGLAATDFVLLVIAADDGPMPQTREHLSIIDLLDIGHAAVVISKIDRVAAARIAEVEYLTRQLLRGTKLEQAPLFAVSASDNIGVDALRNFLIEKSGSKTNSFDNKPVNNNFRLCVDRNFEINGVGFIVTGTIFSGEIEVDEKVTIKGTEMNLRVRGLRVQSKPSAHGRQGQRCALNLSGSGLRKDLIRRGSWVTSARVPAPVIRFDARLRLLNQGARPLAHWTPVHLHLAACEVTARIAVLEGKDISSGSTALVQIVTDQAVGAVFGDRFIIRDQSARTTLGGGRVIDIFPPRRGRARGERITWLNNMDHGDAVETLKHLLNLCPGGVNLDLFFANRNLTDSEESTIYGAVAMTVVSTDDGLIGFLRTSWEALCSRILGEIERAQNSARAAVGLPLSSLEMLLVPESGKGLAKGIVDELLGQSMIVPAAGGYCLATQQTRMNLEDDSLWKSIDVSLSNSGLKPMSVAELVLETRADKRTVISFLGRASHRGLVTRLSPSLVTKPQTLGKIGELLARLTQQHSDGIFTVPSFRDASGIGRNRCIEILEFFDSKRITIRVGEGRRLLPTAKKAFATLLKNDKG